jgi:Domain of unknown function (DUF5667)
MEKMDKRTQKIIDKCHILIKKGYSIDYCLSRYKDCRQEIKDYFTAAESLDKLREVRPGKNFSENSLDLIISRARRRERIAGAKQGHSTVPVRRLILRPAMIFLLIFMLAVFSFSGTLFASQESIPGEALYPLKRSFENFRLNIYPENLKDGLHLQFLNNRISEADALLEEENKDDAILLEELIIDIDKQYRACKRYDCINPGNENVILDSIDSVKNRYQKKYGKNIQNKDQDKSNLEQENQDLNGHNDGEQERDEQHNNRQNKSGNNNHK